MANLRNIFLTGVETLFDTFEQAVNSGTFTQVTDNGFEDATSVTDAVRCIFESFTAKDVELLSFSKLIQPQDIKGLMPFVDIVNCVVSTKCTILFETEEYTVEGRS